MAKVIQEATQDTPLIEYDPTEKVLKIHGKSFPEDVEEAYEPFQNWLSKSAPLLSAVTLDVQLDYFNTASSKKILQFLLQFSKIALTGTKVKVLWKYYEDDEDIEESGKRYRDLSKLDFEFIEFN